MSKYCRDIHSSLDITLTNDAILVTPCCLINKQTTYSNEKFKDLFMPMRTANLSGNLDSELCKECIHVESQNKQSKRQAVNLLWGGEIYNPVGPEYIEVTLDFTCNSACMICGPSVSSYWGRYTDKNSIPISNDFSKIKAMLDTFDLSILKKIQFKGGEPFLSSRNEQFLKYINDRCDISTINLMYHTNGTILPQQTVIDMFKKFKLVEIYISMDDIEDAYEYQRFPTKWDDITNKIIEFRDTMPGNVMFKVEQTISLLNVHRLHKLAEWFENSPMKYNRDGDKGYLVQHYAYGKLALDKISSPHYSWIRRHHPSLIEYFDCPTFNVNNDKMVEFVEDQDNRRNMDINKYFPEFLSFYK